MPTLPGNRDVNGYGALDAYRWPGHSSRATYAPSSSTTSASSKAQMADPRRSRAFVTLGMLRTLMTTPLYTATVRLQIDQNAAKIVEGGNVTPAEGVRNRVLADPHELLQSRAIADAPPRRSSWGEAIFFDPGVLDHRKPEGAARL